MCLCECVSARGNSLHPVILLRRGEDPLVAHVHLAERPAPVALLVEERHGRHDDGADDDGLAVRDDGLLCHHVAHVLYIPSIKKGEKVNKIDNLQRRGRGGRRGDDCSACAPLVRRRYAGGAALHGEHVDGGLGRGEEAAETQEGANCHCRRSPAILGMETE